MYATVSDLVEFLREAASLFLPKVTEPTRYGIGDGILTVRGMPAASGDYQVEIVTPGELGTANFRWSANSSDPTPTWVSATVPAALAGGTYAMGTSGLTLQWSANTLISPSFLAGDIWRFQALVPMPAALEEARSELDTYLASHYAVPLKRDGRMVRLLQCKIAQYYLWVRKGFNPDGSDEHIRLGYTDSVKWLQELVQGRVQLEQEIEEGGPVKYAPKASSYPMRGLQRRGARRISSGGCDC